MGNSLHHKFVKFTDVRLSYNKGRIYYLSELMCEWVWGIEGHDIYKWAKDKEIIHNEDHRSVIDMIYLIKKIRKHRSELEFTKEERERYLVFIKFRRNKKIGKYDIHINHSKGKLYEYIEVP